MMHATILQLIFEGCEAVGKFSLHCAYRVVGSYKLQPGCSLNAVTEAEAVP